MPTDGFGPSEAETQTQDADVGGPKQCHVRPDMACQITSAVTCSMSTCDSQNGGHCVHLTAANTQQRCSWACGLIGLWIFKPNVLSMVCKSSPLHQSTVSSKHVDAITCGCYWHHVLWHLHVGEQVRSIGGTHVILRHSPTRPPACSAPSLASSTDGKEKMAG